MPELTPAQAAHAVPTGRLIGKPVKRREPREARTEGPYRKVRGKKRVFCPLCRGTLSEEPCRVCTGMGPR